MRDITDDYSHKEPHQAFEEAIEAGRLTIDPLDPLWAGKYMYMGTWGDTDHFKHIDTRQYLEPPL